jgi:hypothetical protein
LEYRLQQAAKVLAQDGIMRYLLVKIPWEKTEYLSEHQLKALNIKEITARVRIKLFTLTKDQNPCSFRRAVL